MLARAIVRGMEGQTPHARQKPPATKVKQMQAQLFVNRTLTATESIVNGTYAHFQAHGSDYREIAATLLAVVAELTVDVCTLVRFAVAALNQIVEDAEITEIQVEEVTETLKAAITRVIKKDVCNWVSVLVAGAIGAIAHQASVQLEGGTVVVWDALTNN